jgi:hypothetical protein
MIVSFALWRKLAPWPNTEGKEERKKKNEMILE